MGNFVLVCVLERLEELLVAFDVLAAVRLHAGTDRAFWAVVCERLSQP